MKLAEGLKIEFESGNQFEIVKVFPDGHCDIKALQPLFEWMPDFFPVYYSITLKNYKVLSLPELEAPRVRENEQAKEVCCANCDHDKIAWFMHQCIRCNGFDKFKQTG